ncbi:uncharacterized protein [Oscarella lobularis]|uniref:uncharacterized protein isoform X2 n=1 Tax=Oscarella lobularis TaxID=121494 RepID=UPI0033131452
MSANNILIDALRGVNSPFGKRPNEKVAEFLAGMLQSTPDAFSVATTASDEQGMTMQLRINDRKAVINEFNRQHRDGKRQEYFSYLDQRIAVHHEKVNGSPPTYEIVLKLYDDHYVLQKSGKSSNDFQRKRKSLSPVSCSKRQEFSGYESQEPVESEDPSSSQNAGIQASTALFISAETGEGTSGYESQEPVDGENLSSSQNIQLLTAPSMNAKIGDESSGWESQEPFIWPCLLSELEHLPLPELQEGDVATQTGETMRLDSGIETENDVQETALKDASTVSSSTCYIKPNESSLQGDNVTVICSTLQEDTTYWVTFPDGMGRIEAVCEMSWAGQPCLTIKAPPKEQPGTVVVKIHDLNEQEVNDCPLTLTYVSEENLLIDISSRLRRFAEALEEKYCQIGLEKNRGIDDFIKRWTSTVVKKIERSYRLDDTIRATCEVLCHASFVRRYINGGRFGACEVESSESRRSAAILGIEPSPSKFIQDIVKIAIEDSRDSFREIISSYTVTVISPSLLCLEDYEEKLSLQQPRQQQPRQQQPRQQQSRQQLRHRLEQIKSTRRLEREQRRQRRVERMKRTGKAGKTGEQI